MKTEKSPDPQLQPMPKTVKMVAEQAQIRLGRALPPAWKITKDLNLATARMSTEFDGILTIQNAKFEKMNFLVAVKTELYRRDLERTIEALQRFQKEVDQSAPMIMARFISEPVRKLLKDREISYVDATGNLQLVFPGKDYYIREVGGKSDPWRSLGRPRNTLKGAPAAKVLRALIESPSALSIPELIKVAKSSSGVTYRVIEYLEKENLVTLQKLQDRQKVKQQIVDVKWREIIERWSEDYGFVRSNSVLSYLEPRGLERLLTKLGSEKKTEYVITGSLAANIYAPHATPKLAMIYTKNPYELIDSLGLTRADNGPNVLIASTDYEIFFEQPTIIDGTKYVSPVLAALDLLTSPGRGPTEGEELLNWMEVNQGEWKRKPNS